MAKRKQNEDSLDTFLQQGICVPTSTITLFGEIDDDQAERIVKCLHHLDSLETTDPIRVLIHSSGGCVSAGFAIYDAIVRCKKEVITVVNNEALSMGAVILQAGDKRIARPHSSIMIHDGENTITAHTRKGINSLKRFSDKQNDWVDQIFLEKINEKTHMSRVQFVNKFSHDVWLSPEEALELNLVDEISE